MFTNKIITFVLLLSLIATASAQAGLNIDFNAQDVADIDVINVMGVGYVNITYNVSSDTGELNESTVFLYWMTNGTGGADGLLYENGTLISGFIQDTPTNLSGTWQSLIDDYLYPATYPISHSLLEAGGHSIYVVDDKNDLIKIRLFNISSTKTYGFLELMSNGTGNRVTRIYYCNETYSSGNVLGNDNCGLYSTLEPEVAYNHSHENAWHHVIPFVPDGSGQVAGVTVTPTSYFILRGNTATDVNVYYISSVARADTIQTSDDRGVSWSDFAGTVDMHLHQYDGSEQFNYYMTADNTSGDSQNSTLRLDLLDFIGLPPSAPFVYMPENDTYENTTLNINWTASMSPNGYDIDGYNISLLNNDESFNETLIGDTSLLGYVWDAAAYLGQWIIGIEACDNQSQCTSSEGEMFTVATTSTTSTTTTVPTTTTTLPGCISDDDCAANQWCNVSGLICVADYADEEACTRDEMCVNDNCVVDTCKASGVVCYGNSTGCLGTSWVCENTSCSLNTSQLPVTSFTGGDTTNFAGIANTDAVNVTLEKGNSKVVFTNLNISNALDFDTACEIGDWWVDCDSSVASQLSSAAGNITFVDNSEWIIKLITGLMVTKDGILCTSCSNLQKVGTKGVSFDYTGGFSNYTVINSSTYDAMILNVKAPDWVYMGTVDDPKHMSIMFQLMNTKGESLQDVTCEMFITQTDTGILVQNLETRLKGDETIDNVSRPIPFTDSNGYYRHVFPIVDYPYFSKTNYTLHVTCLHEQLNETFLVRGFQPSNQDDEIEYYQSAMQDIVVGGIIFIIVMYMILRIMRKHQSGELYS